MVPTNADFVRNQCSNGFSHFLLFFAFSDLFFLVRSSKGFFPFYEKTAAQTWLAAQGMVPGQIERIKLFGNGVRSLFLILQGSVLHHCIIICENQVLKILAANLSWSCKKVSFFLVGNPTGNPIAWCKTSGHSKMQISVFFLLNFA